MIKKYSTLFFLIFSLSALFSQEFFIKTGKNNTHYDFQESNTTADFRCESGDFYELGYQHFFKDTKFSYLGSITFNQFNANASDGATSYSWRTNYVGLQNAVSYALFQWENGFKANVKAGFNLATITKGEQFINTMYYDLKNQEEFSGLVLQPMVGLELQYQVIDAMKISLGYQFSKAFNVSNSSEEQLAFVTHQIQFGLHFPLK